jgi:hypothetical protein
MEIKKLFDYSQPLVASTTLFIIALFIIVGYAGKIVTDIKLAGDTIEVTGSAKEAVVADTGRLTITLETKTGVFDQQSGFSKLESAVGKIGAYLKTQELTEFETPTGSSFAQYIYPQNGESIHTGYTVSRSVIVRSSDVEKLSKLANNIEPLSGAGYNVSMGGLELTYSKLDEMRVALLTKAIADATDRANAIAQNSGRKVGQLRNAVGGVVQVLPQGGVDISDYGSYDTQSMNKEVMVTVRATFGLQ